MTTHPPPAGPTVFGSQTTIAGDVNTSGGIFNAGTLTQYNFLAAGTPTRAPVALEVALARLAELPTDHVPPVAALPAGSWLPLPANPHFVGRQPELLALAAALKGGGAAGITPGSATAATGLGGIGKTQLAAAFAHHYGQYFLGGVYWLSFADPAGVSAEVAQCAAWMSDLPVGVTHNAMQRNGSPLPEFESDEERSYFLVRLPVHPAAQMRVDEAESRPSQGRVEAESAADQIITILQQGEASASEIATALGKTSVSGGLKRALRTLLAQGQIEQTIPDKPQSRRQKYRLAHSVRIPPES